MDMNKMPMLCCPPIDRLLRVGFDHIIDSILLYIVLAFLLRSHVIASASGEVYLLHDLCRAHTHRHTHTHAHTTTHSQPHTHTHTHTHTHRHTHTHTCLLRVVNAVERSHLAVFMGPKHLAERTGGRGTGHTIDVDSLLPTLTTPVPHSRPSTPLFALSCASPHTHTHTPTHTHTDTDTHVSTCSKPSA